jgi:hypothetical protein
LRLLFEQQRSLDIKPLGIASECNKHICTMGPSTYYVATPLWPNVRMKPTLPKLGTWSPPGLPNV